MKRKYLLPGLALLLFQYSPLAGQTISGKLERNDSWKPVVYLKEINDYSKVFAGSDMNVIDSAALGKDGTFSFNKLRKNMLYCINVVPGGTANGGTFIQDGEKDNYAFFVTGNTSDVLIHLKGAIDHLYASYTIESPDKPLDHLLQQVLHLRSVKFKHYETMHHFGVERAKLADADTSAITALEYRTMQQIQSDDDSLNVVLGQYMPAIGDPSVLSLALAYYGFDFHLTDAVVQQASARLAKMTATPLSQSVLKATAADQHTEGNDYMQKTYPLLSGGTLKLGDIKSDYILLDFWASWCMPCRKGIRTALKDLGKKYGGKQLTIVGIITDDEKGKAIKAIATDKNEFVQIWQEKENELKSRFGVEALPYYLLINTATGETEHIRTAEGVENKLNKVLGK